MSQPSPSCHSAAPHPWRIASVGSETALVVADRLAPLAAERGFSLGWLIANGRAAVDIGSGYRRAI